MTECFLSKAENNSRMSTHTTIIQNSVQTASQCKKTRKRSKTHADQKAKIKMFADDIIVYRENAQEKKKKHYRINKFSKVMKYKKTYKNQLYFYITAMSM